VTKYFGGIPAKGEFPTPPPTTIPPRIGREIRKTVPDRVPVPRAFIGYRTAPLGTKEHDAMQVAGTVIGGGRGSRLYKSLVLDRQLLQPSDGQIVDTWPFIGGATLTVTDLPAREGIPIDALETAYHAEVAEVAKGVTEDELERAKALITSQWLHHLASVDGRADTFNQYATLLGDPGLVNEALPRLLAVTADDVAKAVSDVMRHDNRVVLTFIPDSPDEQEVAA
jgi:predicted Zn-dependent peptidase